MKMKLSSNESNVKFGERIYRRIENIFDDQHFDAKYTLTKVARSLPADVYSDECSELRCCFGSLDWHWYGQRLGDHR